MFEFFIALFGGSALIFKRISDKSNTQMFEAWEYNSRIKTDSITADENLVVDIINRMENSDSRTTLLQSMSAELTEIYGESWENYFTVIPQRDMIDCSLSTPWSIVFQIELSKNGRIKLPDAIGYNLEGHDEKTRNQIVAMCRTIEKNIQIKHPDYRIVFVPGGFWNAQKKEFDYCSQIHMGKMQWEHTLPAGHIIPIRRLWINDDTHIDDTPNKPSDIEIPLPNKIAMYSCLALIAIGIVIMIIIKTMNG